MTINKNPLRKAMSKPYILTYDLNNPGQKYDQLRKVIENEISTGAWCHYWDSTYLFRSTLSVSEMISKIKPVIDDSDSLFVSEVKSGSEANYSGWLTDKQWSYIKDNILGF